MGPQNFNSEIVGPQNFNSENCGSTKKKSLLKLLWKHNFSIHELVGPQNFEITLVFPQSCHFGDFNTLSFSAVLGDHCLCRLRGFSCSQCNESHPVTELDEIRLSDVVQRFLQALKWGPFLDGGISFPQLDELRLCDVLQRSLDCGGLQVSVDNSVYMTASRVPRTSFAHGGAWRLNDHRGCAGRCEGM